MIFNQGLGFAVRWKLAGGGQMLSDHNLYNPNLPLNDPYVLKNGVGVLADFMCTHV